MRRVEDGEEVRQASKIPYDHYATYVSFRVLSVYECWHDSFECKAMNLSDLRNAHLFCNNCFFFFKFKITVARTIQSALCTHCVQREKRETPSPPPTSSPRHPLPHPQPLPHTFCNLHQEQIFIIMHPSPPHLHTHRVHAQIWRYFELHAPPPPKKKYSKDPVNDISIT